MAFKFPFTNYHELNLTWVLEQLKKLFEDSEENVETIESYENRLSAVETELPTVEATAEQAATTASAAASLAQTAKSTADTANENALTASAQAGLARQEAATAEAEAQAATQAAQQAQATAQNFDGRITQAEADASEALQEAQSFENRVNAAINTANNAANTATIAQGIAVNANQNAAQALDELNAQRDELEAIAAEQIDNINNEANAEKQEIQELADTVIASIPSDYTQLFEDVKNKAPLIVANASGDVASFKDGADNMSIRHLIATINPIQAGTGNPSPSNVRPITGRTGLSGSRFGINQFPPNTVNETKTNSGITITAQNGVYKITGTSTATTSITFDLVSPVNLKPSINKIAFLNTEAQSNLTVDFLREGTRIHYWGMNPVNRVAVGWTDSGNEVVNKIRFSFDSGMTLNLIISPVLTLIDNVIPAFVPYVDNDTFSVSWATEAGTVYGGTLDMITGVLTVTWGADTVNGDSTVSYNGTYTGQSTEWQYVPQISKKNGEENIMSNRFYSSNNHNVGSMLGRAANANIYFSLPENIGSSVSDAKAWFASNPTQIVYELATPQTYQLDPVTVNTLLGNNTVYVDCGSVTVDYPADTKLYIDGKFTELQALILEN